MTRTPVTSAAIKSIGHEGDVLEVEMVNGRIYRYQGVSAADHAKFVGAESLGRHFNLHIARKFSLAREPEPAA